MAFRQSRIAALEKGNRKPIYSGPTSSYGVSSYSGSKGIDKAKLEQMSTQELAALSDRTVGMRTEAAGRSGTRQVAGNTRGALRNIQSQDQERQQQLQGFIDKQMTELDRERRRGGSGKGRRGNVKTIQNPNLAKGSALLDSKKNLL